MAPPSRRPTVVRVSRGTLPTKRVSTHDQRLSHVSVQAVTLHRSKSDQGKPEERSVQAQSMSVTPTDIWQTCTVSTNDEPVRPSVSSGAESKSSHYGLIRLTPTQNRIAPMQEKANTRFKYDLFDRPVNYKKDAGEDERKRRRRRGGFYITKCCCYALCAAILALILLMALIAAIILIAMRSTTTTTTTTTTSTSTTSTSTTSTTTSTTTTSTTSTATTTTTTTTTTTPYDPCANIRWNQTGEIVAGTGTAGSAADEFKDPSCLYIDANETLYICDHHNDRIQMWTKGAIAGTTIAGSGAGGGATALPHAQSLTFDKNGRMYVTSHSLNKVVRFDPGSITGTDVAGSSSGSTLDKLDGPTDMVIDANLNLYIVDSKNDRVVMWAENATSGVAVISDGVIDGVEGILFAPGSTSAVYLSDSNDNAIYLWAFGASSANTTLTQVRNSTRPTLSNPQGIIFDSSNNLFVADKGNNRVVMYCVNSTVGIPVVGEDGLSPVLTEPMDIVFDANNNMYVVSENNVVIKYARI